jgi:hypothetical protein
MLDDNRGQEDDFYPDLPPADEEASTSVLAANDGAEEMLTGSGPGDAADEELLLADSHANRTEDAPAEALQAFEELSLAEVLGLFWYAPRRTLTAFWNAVQSEREPVIWRRGGDVTDDTTDIEDAPTTPGERPFVGLPAARAAVHRAGGLFGGLTNSVRLSIAAVLVAIAGCYYMVMTAPQRTEAVHLAFGALVCLGGVALWITSDIVYDRAGLVRWWQGMSRSERLTLMLWLLPSALLVIGLYFIFDASDDSLLEPDSILRLQEKFSTGMVYLAGSGLLALAVTGARWWVRRSSAGQLASEANSEALVDAMPWFMRIHPSRLVLVMAGTFLSSITFLGTRGNEMPTLIFYLWLASVACWTFALAPNRWWNVWANLVMWANRLRNVPLRSYAWVVAAFAVIMIMGIQFRTDNLTGDPANATAIPQEMTSDHVEKLLDAQRVKDGSRNIFFANNGGREPFQMYAMALFSYLPGQGINYNSLKLLAVVESIISLPFFFLLGYDLMRTENRRFRLLMGLAVMGLVAASYWHVTVTRLGLRIILTPLVTTLLLIYLARAIRDNDRGDWLKTGLILGFGLYTYQAVRMLPVVVLLGAAVSLLWLHTSWRSRLAVLQNLASLIVVAFVVFLPLYHYSIENPDQFWRRTAGRLLGDDIIEERLPNGVIVQRSATLQERIDAFTENIPVLLNNMRNAVLMFNWKGDVAWINNVPNYPALDAVSGGLFVVGIVAWGGLAIRRRDPVYAMMPAVILIMLLPSALSIAFPIENPSFTRTSGALPGAYLLCALPLAIVGERLLQHVGGRRAAALAAALIILPLLASYAINYNFYMRDFARSYIRSALPYSEAGRILRGFATSDGGYGNAFLIAYPYWWDHRAVGLAGGIEGRWPNGVYDTNPNDTTTRSIDYLGEFLSQAYTAPEPFRYDPDRDLLFFYTPADLETSQTLKAWFPQGREIIVPSYQEGDDFMIFRAPALGEAGYQAFMQAHGTPGG